MMSISEIQDKCFMSGRFYQSVIELKKKYPDCRFDDLLRESLENIIKIAEASEKEGVFRSKFYADYFREEIGITLEKGNPFCLVLLSSDFSINMIFILLKECEEWGYIPLLTRGTVGLKESHIVCALDLFDYSRNKSFFKTKRQKRLKSEFFHFSPRKSIKMQNSGFPARNTQHAERRTNKERRLTETLPFTIPAFAGTSLRLTIDYLNLFMFLGAIRVEY